MSLVALADVKDHLGIKTSDTDARLQGKIDAAEATIAQWMNAGTTLAVETVTQRAAGRAQSLVLTTGPVISVTSVTGSYGDTLSVGDLDIDLAGGLIHFQPFAAMPFQDPFYTVVYQAGFTTLSDDLVEAVKELTREYWGSQRIHRPQAGDTPDTGTGLARAQQIVRNRTVSGFA